MGVRSVVVAAVLAVMSAPASAQGVAGKWNASVDTPQGPFAFVFEFMVDGEKLTGTMSNDFMGATPISDGMIMGNELTFKLTFEGGPGGAMTINYKAMVDGDELKVTSTFEGAPPGGGPAEQTFTATRAE